jgi:signal transduction histidine kinase
MAPELELTAYRIIQEALTNIAKHAQARHCRIHVHQFPDAVQIRIEDDGVGFTEPAPRASSSGGLGLIGIRERAAQFGGTMHIDSVPGRGTTLSVELPTRWQTLPASPHMTQHTPIEEDGAYGSLANLPR